MSKSKRKTKEFKPNLSFEYAKHLTADGKEFFKSFDKRPSVESLSAFKELRIACSIIRSCNLDALTKYVNNLKNGGLRCEIFERDSYDVFQLYWCSCLLMAVPMNKRLPVKIVRKTKKGLVKLVLQCYNVISTKAKEAVKLIDG